MRGKNLRYPLSLTLVVITSVLILPLIFLFTVGILAGLLVELFKLYSRISSSELRGYRISKPIEKDNLVLKTKIFKLPLPDKARGRVMMPSINENKLSKVR